MRNWGWFLSLSLSLPLAGLAQTEPAEIRAGSKISAQLESAVDTRTAKPGMEVPARVTKDVKQDGRKVIRKGDLLIGHLVMAEGGSQARGGSKVSIEFDQLRQDRVTTRLNTVVTAIIEPRQENAFPEPPLTMPDAPAPIAGASRGGGSLLGGVGATASSATGTVGPAAGGVGATTSAVGNVSAVAPLKAIHLDSAAQTALKSGARSDFSTRGDHLRLDSGTNLEFRVVAHEKTQ